MYQFVPCFLTSTVSDTKLIHFLLIVGLRIAQDQLSFGLSTSWDIDLTDETHTILLVDDDESLNRLICEYLQNQGFAVVVETNGTDALQRIEMLNPDLVILDVMLPGTDGLGVCRQVRPGFSGPILMLTALGDEIDEVAGLETGADDYLAKPVKPRVLLARIRALLRRSENNANTSSDLHGDMVQDITINEVKISYSARSVTRSGKPVNLTDTEFDLLWLLASRAGKLLSRDEISKALRGLQHDGMDRTIDLRISRLRKKLDDNSREPAIIKSVRGKGYLYAL